MFWSLILDNEAPTFEDCPTSQALNTRPGQQTAVAVWKHPSATDNSGDIPNVICKPLSGSNFTIGQTLVTCEAVDSGGNNVTCSFQIDVKGTSYYMSLKSFSFEKLEMCIFRSNQIQILGGYCVSVSV